MSGPGLSQVASWEPGLLRGALGTLAAVSGRLLPWRVRLEAVGRQLEDASAWSGPAATRAADAVLSLSAVTDAVTRACDTSEASLHRLAGHAAAARRLAEEAVVLAARAGVDLDDGGRPSRPVPGPVPAMAPDQAEVVVARAATAQRAADLAADALRHAALADLAAAESDEDLRRVGVLGSRAPVSFADLAASVGVGSPVVVPPPPADRSPDAVATWWTGLSAASQGAAIAGEPALVGALDGVPGWARDRANRLLLGRALRTPDGPGYATAVSVAAALVAEASSPRPVQLYEFAPRLGLVALALGDVDTADAVGVLVPGILTTAPGDLPAMVDDARRVADAASAAAPALAVATIAWLGYRTPQGPAEVVARTDARVGGRLLDDALDGLAASRAAGRQSRPRTTVLAHSYGTVVVDEAADRPGRLAADAVVLLGSPGMGSGGAASLEASEVYDAGGWADPVPALGWFGQEPWEPGFGAVPLPTDAGEVHTAYYDPAHPTLTALGQVVTGPYRPR